MILMSIILTGALALVLKSMKLIKSRSRRRDAKAI